MSILKKHVAHPVALLAAIATLASGLTCMTQSGSLSKSACGRVETRVCYCENR